MDLLFMLSRVESIYLFRHLWFFFYVISNSKYRVFNLFTAEYLTGFPTVSLFVAVFCFIHTPIHSNCPFLIGRLVNLFFHEDLLLPHELIYTHSFVFILFPLRTIDFFFLVVSFLILLIFFASSDFLPFFSCRIFPFNLF